jgi:hypothetical protein
MDNKKQNDDFPIKILLIGGVIYAIYSVVEMLASALYQLFMGIVNIALVAGAISAAYFLYRFITNKEFGEQKKMRQIERIEKQRESLERLPVHLREQAAEYYTEKQRALYDMKPGSRFDAVLDRTKQVFSTFRRGKEGPH